QREAHDPQHRAAEFPEPVNEGPTETPPEASEPSPAEAPSTPPAAPSVMSHRRDDDERRGRRSRRRRNRGRGFPDSKYASDSNVPRAPEQREHVPEARQGEPAMAEPFDFSVLPGESLAKYRRPEHTQSE